MKRPQYIFVSDNPLKAKVLKVGYCDRPLIFTVKTNLEVLEHLVNKDVAGVILDLEAEEKIGENNYTDFLHALANCLNSKQFICAVSNNWKKREKFRLDYAIQSYDWNELAKKIKNGSLPEKA